MKSILKRIKNGELIVIQTDKSGKFAILSVEDYNAAGHVHTNKDEQASDEFVKETQTILNCHCSNQHANEGIQCG